MEILTIDDIIFHIEDILKEQYFWDRDRRFTRLLTVVRLHFQYYPFLTPFIVDALKEMIRMSREEKCVCKPQDTEVYARNVINILRRTIS